MSTSATSILTTYMKLFLKFSNVTELLLVTKCFFFVDMYIAFSPVHIMSPVFAFLSQLTCSKECEYQDTQLIPGLHV